MKPCNSLLSSTAVAALCFFPTLAVAQITPAQVDSELSEVDDLSVGSDIVVTGERLRGQLQVEQAPILELDEADIEGIGANSIAELLEVVAPQTSSSRRRGGGGGGPAILVNGLRISSFRELRSYPPEAIRKVEVLPEEVAVKFGFSADQRVVNLILKDNFSSREAEVEYEGPSDGGYVAKEAEFTLLKLDQGKRLNVTAEVSGTSLLDESERDIVQTEGSTSDLAGDPDPARFRSLVDDSLDVEATINWTTSNLDNGSLFSLNGTYEREENTSLSGLNSVLLADQNGNETFRTFGADTPLRTRSSSDSVSAGSTYTKPLGAFQFTATANANLTETETLIDNEFDTQTLIDAALAGTIALDGALPANADAGFATARNRVITSDNQVTFRGNPLSLPAGEVSTTLDLGFEWRRIESDDTRTDQDTRLSRSTWEIGGNVGIPVAERGGAWGAIGDVTLNFTGGVEELSDFGTLLDGSAGVTWGVADSLSLSATYVYTEVAPSLSQLGGPQITTFNSTVFDFVNGESVLAAVTTGGNQDLEAETQKDWKFAANWEVPGIDRTRFSAEYIRNRSSNVTSSFPAITQAIEEAFPDRITRDNTGRLIALDRRAVTFDQTRSERLVFGLTTRGGFGGARPEAGGGANGPSRGNGPAGIARPQRGQRPGADQAGRGSGGPPSDEQRARFMAFRERICADDGLNVLTEMAQAVAEGVDILERFPDLGSERAARMVSRSQNEDGSIDQERLAGFRERICSADPSAFGGAGGAGRPAGGPGADQTAQGGPPGGSANGGGGNRASRAAVRGFGRDGRGRYFINLSHSIELDNTFQVGVNTPVLDQLDGDTTAALGFPRHTSSLRAGIFKSGKGARLNVDYTGSARVNGSGLPGSSDLFINDLLTIDLRVFVNLGEVLDKPDTFLSGMRLAFRADNVFNARRDVRDGNGDVPLTFQPDLLDPTGRYVGIDIRKMF